jgi:hypothetical protein
MMKLSWIGSVLFVLIVGCYEVSLAQETDTKWLIGVWEGESGSVGVSQPSGSTVEFKDEGGGVRFDLLIISSPFPRLVGSKARGSGKVSGDAVTMQGEYYAGGATGPLSYSLTRKGDVPEGTGIGSGNMQFRIVLRKFK